MAMVGMVGLVQSGQGWACVACRAAGRLAPPWRGLAGRAWSWAAKTRRAGPAELGSGWARLSRAGCAWSRRARDGVPGPVWPRNGKQPLGLKPGGFAARTFPEGGSKPSGDF
jgi:hypothetical protein